MLYDMYSEEALVMIMQHLQAEIGRDASLLIQNDTIEQSVSHDRHFDHILLQSRKVYIYLVMLWREIFPAPIQHVLNYTL